MNNKLAVLFAIPLFLIATVSYADYCAVGEIKGNICKGFVIESCRHVRVDAVKGDDGRLFSVKTCYSEVSDYRESDDRCWIRTKSKGLGFWSSALNAAKQPEFFTKKENGEYEEIDVEYLVFKCVKR
jgi:hypothetical protein